LAPFFGFLLFLLQKKKNLINKKGGGADHSSAFFIVYRVFSLFAKGYLPNGHCKVGKALWFTKAITEEWNRGQKNVVGSEKKLSILFALFFFRRKI